MGMKIHQREWRNKSARELIISMIYNCIFYSVTFCLLLVIIELDRSNVNLILILDKDKAAIENLLGKMLELGIQAFHLVLKLAIASAVESLKALFQIAAFNILFINHIIVIKLLL